MKITRAAVLAALLICASAGLAAADDVTLTSRDGSVKITGNLLGYDGEFFRVDSKYGVLTVDGGGVLCAGPGCPDLRDYVVRFTISGSRTIGEVLMPALVESFARRSGYRIERQVTDDTHFNYLLSEKSTGREAAEIGFRVSSTSEGFADLLANEADIVLSMRQATEQEQTLAREAGLGDLANPRRSRIVALDALVPVVASANPVRGLTMMQLAQVFSREIDNWSLLGGPDAPIVLHLRDELSGITQEFQSRVLDGQGKTLAPAVIRHLSNNDLADSVARDLLAIGIATYSDTGNTLALPIEGTCGIRFSAGEIAMKAEDYPLTLPLFVYTPARHLPVLIREFLSFIRSPAAQAVIDRAGFVDLHLRESPIGDQGQRLANAISAAGDETTIGELQRLVQGMRGSRRLSLSFRFRIGGTDLDAQSLSNVDILAQKLEAGAFDDKRLIFVGFSDGEGPAAANLRLARRRAQAVRAAVKRAAATADRNRLTFSVDAFGESMPMACDDEDWGRQINRRVEVWIE